MKMKKSEILNATQAIPSLQKVKWKDGRMFFKLALLHKGLLPLCEAVQEQIQKVTADHKTDGEFPSQCAEGDSGDETPEWQAYDKAVQDVLGEEESVDIKIRIPEEYLEKYRDDGEAPEFAAVYQIEPFIVNGEAK